MTKITGKPRNPRDSTATVSADARVRALAKLAQRIVAREQRHAALEQRVTTLEATITALKKILKPWPI